jgi:hypothetical protein
MRRSARGRAAGMVAAALLLAGLGLGDVVARGAPPAARIAKKPGNDGSKAKKGRSNMTLDLRIKLQRSKVITGESVPVEITLENQGAGPVEVPDAQVGSDFRYTVTAHADAQVVYHLGAAQTHAQRYQEPPPPRTSPGKTLAPGGKESYAENLAEYEQPLIGPGAYDVIVGLAGPDGLVESAPAPLTITPARATHLVAVAGRSEERLGVLFAHAADAKHAILYQIENVAGRPGDGVAFPRKEGLAPGELRGLALAVDLGDCEGRRWFAWEDGGSIGAGAGQERYLSHLVPPVAHGLGAASLAPFGWQATGDAARFVALGKDKGGHAALAIIDVDMASPGHVRTVPVAIPASPAAWAVQYRKDGGDEYLELVAALHSGHATQVIGQTIALGSGHAGAPVAIGERPGVVAGLVLPPVAAGSGTDAVDLLLGPDPKTGYMSFVRLPLGGGRARAAWNFGPPKATHGKHPTDWAMPRALLEPPMFATHAGDAIYLRRLGGEWSVLADGVPHADHLSVEVFPGGGMVAVWSDPQFGIRYQAVK